MRAWHGTFSQNGSFSNFNNHQGFISFALDKDHARSYAVGVQQELWREGSKIFEVNLKIVNPLDYRVKEHVSLVKSYLKNIDFNHFPENDWDECIGMRGAYQCLEHRELLESNGFDAVYTCESGWRNIHILNPATVEIVKVYVIDPGQEGLSDNFGHRIESGCCA